MTNPDELSANFFRDVNEQLSNGWYVTAVSVFSGAVRLQLADEVYVDFGFRTGVSADTLDEAIKAAVDFSQENTPDEYFSEW
jgi:hypothetical protein